MIDVENEIYTRVADVLEARAEDVNITSTYTPTPAAFPHVSIEVSNNAEADRYAVSGAEQAADITVTVNVYSAAQTGRKAEAKKLAGICDGILHGLHFRRTADRTNGNADDRIYRITAIYEGTVDKDGICYSK